MASLKGFSLGPSLGHREVGQAIFQHLTEMMEEAESLTNRSFHPTAGYVR